MVNEDLISQLNKLDKKFTLEMLHNEMELFLYPETVGWNLVAFPAKKGEPFNSDNLATVNKPYFMSDTFFSNYLVEAEQRWGDKRAKGLTRRIDWRLHVYVSIALSSIARRPESPIAEFGVGSGYMMAALLKAIHSLGIKPPQIYLFDNFALTINDENRSKFPGYANDHGRETIEYFSKYRNVKFIIGDLPNSLSQYDLPAEDFSFVSIDLNSAQVEASVLSIFESARHSTFLFDDSLNPFALDQFLVHKEFAMCQSRPLMELPTGQAVIL